MYNMPRLQEIYTKYCEHFVAGIYRYMTVIVQPRTLCHVNTPGLALFKSNHFIVEFSVSFASNTVEIV